MSRNAAWEIKRCANACNAYSRQRLLVKFFRAHGWDQILKEHIRKFAARKVDFDRVILMHTAFGVDKANKKLDNMRKQWVPAHTEHAISCTDRLPPPTQAGQSVKVLRRNANPTRAAGSCGRRPSPAG